MSVFITLPLIWPAAAARLVGVSEILEGVVVIRPKACIAFASALPLFLLDLCHLW